MVPTGGHSVSEALEPERQVVCVLKGFGQICLDVPCPLTLGSNFSGIDRKLPGAHKVTCATGSTELLDLWSVVSADGELLVPEPKCIPLFLGS